MRIGIDVSMLVYRGSGVANYTYNMVKHLLLYDKKNEYRLFYSSLRRPPRLLELFWNKWHIVPVEWLIGKVDWYFSSDFLRPPLLKGTKGITTIHDLTWKVFPQYHTQRIVDAHHRKLERTTRFGDTIICDSNNTKKDLLHYYPEAGKRCNIKVIYPGIDDRFRPILDQKEIAKVLSKYNVAYPKRYLLYVGAIEPRKNLDTAINVFAQLISDHAYADFEFLIVGRAGWKNEELFQLIHDLKLEHKVRFVGFVEDDDLPYFYNACQVNIYLSKYEGFGLPPVEAAACGKRSLMYSHSSLSEICSDFAEPSFEESKLKSLIQDSGQSFPMTKQHLWSHFVSQFQNALSKH